MGLWGELSLLCFRLQFRTSGAPFLPVAVLVGPMLCVKRQFGCFHCEALTPLHGVSLEAQTCVTLGPLLSCVTKDNGVLRGTGFSLDCYTEGADTWYTAYMLL